MAKFTTPRVIITGVTSAVGKSLFTLGLILALKKRKLNPSVCVSGTCFYTSMLYKRIINRYINTLDQSQLTAQQILSQLKNAAKGADILVIDGTAGLYDSSSPTSYRGSDAFLATLTETPVINIADVSNFSSSLGALVKGYREAAGTFDYGGTIGNRFTEYFGNEEAKDKVFYDCSLELFGNQSLLGAIPIMDEIPFSPPKYDTQHAPPPFFSRQFLYDLCDKIEASVNIEQVLEITDRVYTLDIPYMEEVYGRRCRIAVADDNAFGICYQENLDLLSQYGAEIVRFSPLIEDSLPKDVGAVYFPGAFVKDYAKDLSDNVSLRESIMEFADKGGAIYSEGGGTAYLCNTFTFEDCVPYEGVGLIDGDATAVNSEPSSLLTRPSQYILRIEDDSILGIPGYEIKGVKLADWEFHIRGDTPKIAKAYVDSVAVLEGYSPTSQSLCVEGFLNFASTPQVAKNLVDSAELLKV